MKVKLGQAFELQMGKTPSRNNALYWNGTNKWISIADLGNAEKYISETKESITESALSETGIKVVPEGTVIMSFNYLLVKLE
ncbi:restriction endonuclease subunit S [Lachnospiraceae bacterium KK002]